MAKLLKLDTEIETLMDLKQFIQQDAELRFLRSEVEHSLLDDPGHDIHHAMRVALWTIRLNPGGSVKNAVSAALLHDIVNIEKNDPRRDQASSLSAERARNLLSSFKEAYSDSDIDDICGAIRDHSFSRGAQPTTDLGKALQDADRLEALGVLGAFRNISCGVRMGASFFDPEDPWATKRPLNDKKFSIDHYKCKLLKLQGMMNTEQGKVEGKRRTETLLGLLTELGEEIGYPYPEIA